MFGIIFGLVVRVPDYRSRDPVFDSRLHQILWEVVGLERGAVNLVSTSEELLGRKSTGSGLEIREYGLRDPSRWPRGILYLQKLVLTTLTSDGCSVGIVRSRTQSTEFRISFFFTCSTRDLCALLADLVWRDFLSQCSVLNHSVRSSSTLSPRSILGHVDYNTWHLLRFSISLYSSLLFSPLLYFNLMSFFLNLKRGACSWSNVNVSYRKSFSPHTLIEQGSIAVTFDTSILEVPVSSLGSVIDYYYRMI
jgi:hypothetical protein